MIYFWVFVLSNGAWVCITPEDKRCQTQTNPLKNESDRRRELNKMGEILLTSLLALAVAVLGFVVFISRYFRTKLKIILISLEEQEKNRIAILENSFNMKSSLSRSSRRQRKMSKKSQEEFEALRHNTACRSLSHSNDDKPAEEFDDEIELYEGDLADVLKLFVPFLDEFANHPEQFNVCPEVVPGFLYNALPSHPPENPCALEAIWDDYKTYVFPGYTHWQHPNFVAYFPLGRCNPDTVAEFLISSLCVPTENWAACPALAELEASMTNWIGRSFGLPEEMLFHGNTETSKGGGLILESASEAIFMALTVARTRKIDEILHLKKELQTKEHFHEAPTTRNKLQVQHELAGRMIVYTNTEAHSSIEKGARLATLDIRQLKGNPQKDFSLTAEILERAIEEDLAVGKIPCMLHVILGSTSSCCFDSLAEIGPIAKKHGMWIHVDSAFAGSMWIEPSYRQTQSGLEWIDSIDINLHKSLLHSNGMSIFWTKDLKAVRNTFSRFELEKKGRRMGDDWSEMFIHDSRRHKALKTFFVYKCLGTDGLREFIRNCNEMAAYLRQLMSNHPNIRFFGELKPALFSFQYFEPGMTEEEITYHSECLHTFFNETGQIRITYSSVHGHGIIRISAGGYMKTNKEDMDRLWATMRGCIDTYRERKSDPGLMRFPPTSPTPKTARHPTPPTSP